MSVFVLGGQISQSYEPEIYMWNEIDNFIGTCEGHIVIPA